MGKQKPGGITWTDYTWNPLRGCTRVSEGCRNCYAERTTGRGLQPGQPFHGFALPTADGPRWTGKVKLMRHLLSQPASWREPRTIFVNSMSDTWHESLPIHEVDQIYAAMLQAPRHVYLVLTKRAHRLKEITTLKSSEHFVHLEWRSIWHGVSVENQQAADERIPLLLDTPCAHRFLSLEPLLGPVHLKSEWLVGLDRPRIDWVIVGGESGPDARPMHPDWVRNIRLACKATGVKFHFKQWGEWRPPECERFDTGKGRAQKYPAFIVSRIDGTARCFDTVDTIGTGNVMVRVGKKAAGRELDGQTHDWMPRPEGVQP